MSIPTIESITETLDEAFEARKEVLAASKLTNAIHEILEEMDFSEEAAEAVAEVAAEKLVELMRQGIQPK